MRYLLMLAVLAILGVGGVAAYQGMARAEEERDRQAETERAQAQADAELTAAPTGGESSGEGNHREAASNGAVLTTSSSNSVADATSSPIASANADEASSGEIADSADKPIKPKGDPLEQGLIQIMNRATERDVDVPKLEAILVRLLEMEDIGSLVTREATAKETVATIVDQASRSTGQVTGPAQVQAMAAIAKRLATSFRSGLVDASGQRKDHTGTVVGAAAQFEAPDGYEKLSWKTLGDFEYHEGMTLPKHLTELEGKKVAVAGYMVALGQYEDIHEFVLVESQWSCCFGIPPDINQVIVVTIPIDEEGLDLVAFPLVITGTFEVGEAYEDGYVTSLYRLDVHDVQEME